MIYDIHILEPHLRIVHPQSVQDCKHVEVGPGKVVADEELASPFNQASLQLTLKVTSKCIFVCVAYLEVLMLVS